MEKDEYAKLKKAFEDAKKSYYDHAPSKPLPVVMSAPHGLIHKDLNVAQLKSMTEDELLAELKNAKPEDAEMIVAELLKPTWTLVAGYWAVIAGMALMIVVALIVHF